MDNHKQIVKNCGVCGNEGVYNVYHRFFIFWKICVAKSSARYYQTKRRKNFANSKLHQENTKIEKILYTTHIKLNNVVEEITQAMDTLILEIE